MSTVKSECQNCRRVMVGIVRQCPHCCSDLLVAEVHGATETHDVTVIRTAADAVRAANEELS